MRVSYIDCLDRFHPEADRPSFSADGRGAYRKTQIPLPVALSDVPARFFRYGIEPRWLAADLAAAGHPDLVFVTSHMTYWYTGVRETVDMVKAVFPGVPVVLGGIYATLLPDHARAHSGACEVAPGPGEETVFRLVQHYTGFSCAPGFDTAQMDALPRPAFDLQSKIPYIPVLTTRGCPNRCAYCASHFLQPRRMRRSPNHVAAEIAFWHKRYGVSNAAFYDDALLADADDHAIPLFEALCTLEQKVAFHTPNAVHVRPITQEIAGLMYRAGFRTLRLGLETADGNNRDIDDKVGHEEFVRAVRYLLEAGFDAKHIGAYLLTGLPGQDLCSVEVSIDRVKQYGIRPVLTYYTPIPHTRMWAAACAASRYDLAAEPLFTNNSLMPCMLSYDRTWINRLKQRAALG